MVSMRFPLYCVPFLYWGKGNLVVLPQREFLFRSLCTAFVDQEAVELKDSSSRTVLISCKELVDFIWWNFGAWHLENQVEAVAEDQSFVDCVCVRESAS